MKRAPILLGVFALLVIAAAFALPPMFDETYYWTWSRDLSPFYVNHPPGVAFVLALSTKLFGDNLVGLRLPSLLSMAGIILLLAAAASRLSSDSSRSSWLVVLTLLSAPMFVIGYLPSTPDPYQGFVIAVGAFALVRALEEEAAWYWPCLVGFALTFGVIVKHSSALLFVGVLIGLAATGDGRKLLKRPYLWAGLAVGVLSILPWALADLTSGGATSFQFSRVFSLSRVRGPVAIPMTLGSMMGTLGPVTALVLIWLAISVFKKRSAAVVAMSSGAMVLLVACNLAVWLGSGEANWPMPALILGAPAIVSLVASASDRSQKIYVGSCSASGLFCVVALLHIIHPFAPLAPNKDRTLRAAGFEEVAVEASRLLQEHRAKAIVTRRYQVASMMRYHTRDRVKVVELGTPKKSQYDVWPKIPLCSGDNAVVVLPRPGVPRELAAKPIASPVPIRRHRNNRVLDTYYVTVVRLTKPAFDPKTACSKVHARRGSP